MTKTFFTSKTIWFGILQIAFGLVGLAFHLLDVQTCGTLIVTGLASVGLRLNTSQPIS